MRTLLFLVSLAVAALVSTPAVVRACGGCFAPPATATVVTAHRMAVSFTSEQTTLWDQIQYAGAPEDFVWVLPVQGGVPVELASNELFAVLEGESAPVLSAWSLGSTVGCVDCPCCSAASVGAPSETVTVHNEAVIGPYETATIGSDDPNALIGWLQEHGYAVPDATLTLIDHYVAQGMDFAVLRLRPGVGVQQMQPVRVTMPGVVPVFPLRMVGAGIADEVEVLLFVLGEGRYAPENYPHATIDRNSLVFDWTSQTYNYDEAFAAAVGERSWITEHAGPLGASLPWAEAALAPREGVYLTRLRTRLGPQDLDQDLVLSAVALPDVSRYLEVTRSTGVPPSPACPPPGSCGSWGRDPDRDSMCSAGGGDPSGWAALLAVCAWLLASARRVKPSGARPRP